MAAARNAYIKKLIGDDEEKLPTEVVTLSPTSSFCSETIVDGKEWTIHDLCEADLPDVILICGEAFPLDYPEYWYKQVVQGKFISYGLFHRNTLTSLLVAEIKYGRDCDLEDRGLLCSDDDARVVYILSLAVRRDYQRRGIATRLLDHLSRIVGAQSPLPKLMFLHVLAQNHAAIAFYERNGFCYFTTLSSYYQIKDVSYDGFTMVNYIVPKAKARRTTGYLAALGAMPKYVCGLVTAVIFSPLRLVLRLKPSSLPF